MIKLRYDLSLLNQNYFQELLPFSFDYGSIQFRIKMNFIELSVDMVYSLVKSIKKGKHRKIRDYWIEIMEKDSYIK